MALSVDHQAFIDILTLGEGDIGGAMQPPPEGVWGMPPEVLGTLPGYTPDVARNRAQARGIMEKLSYGPDNRLAIKVSARNIVPTRDPAALLIGQLKEIYIGGEIEMVDTTNWYPKVLRKDFTVGMMVSENGSMTRIRVSMRTTRAILRRRQQSLAARCIPHVCGLVRPSCSLVVLDRFQLRYRARYCVMEDRLMSPVFQDALGVLIHLFFVLIDLFFNHFPLFKVQRRCLKC
jgi:hypothetical protein